ncbi:MAG: hypothetical protein PVF83_05065 [Anaerolineales bacterium]|jgi:hypothetical protein
MDINIYTQKFFRLLLLTGVVLFLVAFVGMLYIFSRFLIDDYKRDMAWRETLSPLPQETIEKLCEIFNLRSGERRCNTSKQVYSYQFYGDVYRFLYEAPEMQDDPLPTFDEVEELIGEYKQGCNSFEDGYFYCWYKFSGEDEDPITLYFDENEILFMFVSRHLE